MRALARERETQGIVTRIRHETDALIGCNGLSAGAGGGLCGSEGSGTEPLQPALCCALSGDLQGWTAQTAADQPADAAAGAPGSSATYDYDYTYMQRGPYTLWLSWSRWARGVRAWGARPAPAVANRLRSRQAERLILVCDHWNTHTYASFDWVFPPDEARRRARRVQWVFTPRTAVGSTGPNRN